MRIPRALYDEIVEHAVADAPKECCGVVAARDGDLVKVYRMRNERDSQFSFEMDGRELMRVLDEIDDAGEQLVALYHSHTRSAPKPSLKDKEYVPGWADTLWIIVGVKPGDEPEMRVWSFRGKKETEVELVVE
jgi:[CysO sulfur-carrier protein]-S-L-cysteine hydrolase